MTETVAETRPGVVVEDGRVGLQGVEANLGAAIFPESKLPVGAYFYPKTEKSNTAAILRVTWDGEQRVIKVLKPENAYLNHEGGGAAWSQAVVAETIRMQGEVNGIGLVGVVMFDNSNEPLDLTLLSEGENFDNLVSGSFGVRFVPFEIESLGKEQMVGLVMPDFGTENNLFERLGRVLWGDEDYLQSFERQVTSRAWWPELMGHYARAIAGMVREIPEGVAEKFRPENLATAEAYRFSILEGNLNFVEDKDFVRVYTGLVEAVAERFGNLFASRKEQIKWRHGDPALGNAFMTGKDGRPDGVVLIDPIALRLKNGEMASWPFLDWTKELAGVTSLFSVLARMAVSRGRETLADFYEEMRGRLIADYVVEAGVGFGKDEETLLKIYEAYWGQVRGEIYIREAGKELENPVVLEKGEIVRSRSKMEEGEALLELALLRMKEVLGGNEE